MKILSIVSGTSTDGLSMAIFDLKGTGLDTKFTTVASRNFEYDSDMRHNLLKIASGEKVTTEFISGVHWELGRVIQKCAGEFEQDFDIISYSGHTAYHGPSTGNINGGTFQIGEISILAARTGKTAVYDYRTSDMAYGGLGAPLTAVTDYFILHEPGTLAVNIGGIGNITYIGENGFAAFDTGPGNMLIDLAAMKLFGSDYDKDGQFASKGKVNESMLERMLDDHYLSIRPPKNSGREYYNQEYLDNLSRKFKDLSSHDFIRTITRFTAASIHDQVDRFIKAPVKKIIAGGGGTLNPLIIHDLEELFRMKIMNFSDIGIDDMIRECLGFAILANQTIHMKPGRLRDFRKLSGNVIGKIFPGENFQDLFVSAMEENE